jgi:uncharacterized protein
MLPAFERCHQADRRTRGIRTQRSNQIVVATVPDLGELDIADYGYQLGRQWGIGSKGHDNGAVLIVAAART